MTLTDSLFSVTDGRFSKYGKRTITVKKKKQQTDQSVTFLFLPGLLLCQVSQEVQGRLGLWGVHGGTFGVATDGAASSSAAAAAVAVGLRFHSALDQLLLRAQLGFHQLVAVVEDIL